MEVFRCPVLRSLRHYAISCSLHRSPEEYCRRLCITEIHPLEMGKLQIGSSKFLPICNLEAPEGVLL